MTQPPGGFTSWNDLYRQDGIERLPWYLPELDPDLAAALERHGITSGRALDLGTGPGTQAIALAERGFEVTATDVSPAAIAYATRKARARAVRVTFVEDDVTSTRLGGTFAFVFDRGCFHVLPPERRAVYAATARRLLAPGGILFLKTCSHRQPGSQGPHRFTPEDIRHIFVGDLFDGVEIEETVFQGQLEPRPFALFCTLRARG